MKKTMLATCLIFFVATQIGHAQNIVDTSNQAKINGYYQLALQYKNGTGVPIDYEKAYQYFAQASALGDAQSLYAVGYMQYKGLGCLQDYVSAAAAFAKGALQGRDNSLYFYGLCWRNGYGLAKNEDSAKYYLNKSAALGYKQAYLELEAIAAENSNDSAAAILMAQLHNAAIPIKAELNKYNKVQHHLPAADIVAGEYCGWLMQYDWSGSHIVSTKQLQLSISGEGQTLHGQWIEEKADTATFKASLVSDAVQFYNTQYKRTDHYSPNTSVGYDFNTAILNLVQAGDSVFLAGNVNMFSPQRGEPSKPLFVALARSAPKDGSIANITAKAYPNPFVTSLTIEFSLLQKAEVEVQLLNINGAIVYRNPAGLLDIGSYTLPISTTNLAAGTYIVKMVNGKLSTTFKVVKQ